MAAQLPKLQHGPMNANSQPVGTLLRTWRDRRRRSQLDVALAAGLSTRHLSYVETGRSTPSRQMIERLCEELDVPLRERNPLYLAAGYAPVHQERAFDDLGTARVAVSAVLTGHEPHPALAVNVRWELLAANRAAAPFFDGVSPELTRPPVNVLRATLHPKGLAPRIRNLGEWRTHVLRRVRRQLDRTRAPGLADLLAELQSYPIPGMFDAAPGERHRTHDLAVPLHLSSDDGDLALLYTTMVFGSPRDVTLDEIAIETFFPADARTAGLLGQTLNLKSTTSPSAIT
jgi:transcriptional regulator with XRE-family HTH domain